MKKRKLATAARWEMEMWCRFVIERVAPAAAFLGNREHLTPRLRAMDDADFARLKDLERKGRLHNILGQVFVGAGAAAIVVGTIRAIVQLRSQPSEARTVRLEPIPVNGGAVLVLTMGMP